MKGDGQLPSGMVAAHVGLVLCHSTTTRTIPADAAGFKVINYLLGCIVVGAAAAAATVPRALVPAVAAASFLI